MDQDWVIEADGLTRRFGALVAVDQVSLRIPPGRIYGFLGPNGSGKSTTIRMLCGLLTPSAGTARVLGYRLPGPTPGLKRELGYMTQRFSLYEDLDVVENLRFMADIYGLDRAAGTGAGRRQARAARQRRLDEQLERYRLTEHARQRAATLSGGQKQRLALAAATLHQPRLLLLDEPTSAVDPQSRRDFWDTLFDLAAAGTTILVSTHYMDEAERCHRLAILQRGVVVADGSPVELYQAMDAVVVEVDGTDCRAARARLAGVAGIHGATQLGVRLRVLVDRRRPDPVGLVRALLADAGLAGTPRLTAPGLEDVFVSATRAEAPAPGGSNP